MTNTIWDGHPLAGLGRAALTNQSLDELPQLAEFTTLVSDYGQTRSLPWPKVHKLALELAPKRPDIKVFVFLCLSAYAVEWDRHEEGEPYLSLGAALSALADLVEEGWNRCGPRNPKARENQIGWLSQELGWLVKERPPAAKEADAFLATLSAAERLGRLLGRAVEVEYVLFKDARDALALHRPRVEALLQARERATSVPQAVPLGSQKTGAGSVAPPAAPPPAAEPGPSSSPPAESRTTAAVATVPAAPSVQERQSSGAAPLNLDDLSLEDVEDRLASLVLKLARALRTESLTNPAPYWLVRALRWANHDLLRSERIREIASNEYKTPLPRPPALASVVEEAPKWVAEKQYARVIEECEELLAICPLALDLNRFVCQALEGLGATAARQAVSSQVLLLLSRSREILKFKFGDFDGTPFATPETVTWLESEQQRGAADGKPSSSMDEVVLPAELGDGLRMLEQRIAAAPHAQQRFELELRMTELLLRHQRRDVAFPIILGLLDRAVLYRLAEWRPDLLAQVLRLGMLASQPRQSADAEEHQDAAQATQRKEIWNRLCQVSPAAAVEIRR